MSLFRTVIISRFSVTEILFISCDIGPALLEFILNYYMLQIRAALSFCGYILLVVLLTPFNFIHCLYEAHFDRNLVLN